MANENTITIKINADGSYAINGINQVTNTMKNMETETQGIVSQFKEHWVGVTAAITGALYTMKKAWDLAEMAAGFQEQKTALNALAAQYNITADSIIASVKQASNGLISMTDTVSVSAKALMAGLNPDQLVQFMRIVETTTNVTGDSVANSFERIIQAAAIGNERALKHMGIIVDLQGAYKHYADSINIAVQELDELTRQQIGVNAILDKGNETLARLGNQADSTADKMERLRILVQDLKLQLGELLLKGIGVVMIGFYELEGTVARVGKAFAWLGMQSEKMGNIMGLSGTAWKESFEHWTTVLEHAETKGDEYFKALFDKAQTAAEPVVKLNNLLFEQGNILSTMLPGVKLPEPVQTISIIDPKKEKERTDQVIKILHELYDREALLGKTADAQELIQLQQKQRDEMKILADAHASFAQMDEASRIHTLENDALVAEQKKKNIEEQERLNEQLYRREMELQGQAIELQNSMYEDAWSRMMNISNMIGGEAGRGIGQFNMGMKGLFDIGTGRDQYSSQLAELQNYYGEKFQLMIEGGAIEADINQANLEYQLAQQHVMQQQKLAIYSSYTNAVMGLLTAMGAFMGKHNKALFYMQQLAAIAITIVNTIAAAMAALAPPPLGLGPIAGIPLAAAISAAGAMSVAAIMAQTVAGGGGGKSVPMPSGGYIYNDTNRPRFEQSTDKQKSLTMNIYVNGNIIDNDAFARELVPSIQKALSDNVQ
ncbi:MAG TPA: hypothetical protein ACFYEK_09120 [Candidatus Wunengus sp. YC60]|uniref:hypothetical protein n=1 Tax=Candidatus Wunengus sp. YC60 TaxID=3367697 RepID=UPI0040299136